MKANEAKSKFVYPDKLYAKCKNNKTLDISYASQNIEAVEYTRTDTFIEKACEWLNKELPITDLSPSNMLNITFKVFDKECKKEFIEDFKKYMEGE